MDEKVDGWMCKWMDEMYSYVFILVILEGYMFYIEEVYFYFLLMLSLYGNKINDY